MSFLFPFRYILFYLLLYLQIKSTSTQLPGLSTITDRAKQRVEKGNSECPVDIGKNSGPLGTEEYESRLLIRTKKKKNSEFILLLSLFWNLSSISLLTRSNGNTGIWGDWERGRMKGKTSRVNSLGRTRGDQEDNYRPPVLSSLSHRPAFFFLFLLSFFLAVACFVLFVI